MSDNRIRKGQEQDLPRLLELIRELAEFEHGLDQVDNSIERMKREGFGDEAVFGFIVAEQNDYIIGASIYYYRYSTWKGKRLYLEDLIVSEPYRGRGVGKMLFEETLSIAKRNKCGGMMWQVLDWNEPAIRFYEKYNAKFDSEWINCHIDL